MATTLVMGGTGKTGRRVAQRLQARGLPVRIGTPSSKPPFDWDDQATWAPALQDIGSVYLTYYPDLASPGADERVGAFADLAVARGVRRLVLLSGRGEEERPARRAGGAGLRRRLDDRASTWFMAQNFSESFFLEPRAGRRGRLSGWRGRCRAVRRRRRHRRRRGRGPDRRPARRPAV